ncbi:bacteriohemerythrin [candidate division KSB1 bacterium]
MEEVKWSKEFETGIHWIDTQHKSIINRIDKMNKAIDNNRGEIEVDKMLVYLDEYTKSHFTMEEEYMKKYNYPEQNFHEEQHRDFVKSFEDIKRSARNSRPILKDMQYELWQYFRYHITIIDGAFARFLKSKKAT